ncbi:MAG: response regulator [Anaerolineaceae bacterium]|nr:response regulator [Anaerolineaceae bacterium]
MGIPRERVLLVESDPVISDLVGRQALQSLGYEIQIVTDGSAAISKAIQYRPDAVIINLNLPGLSGKDLLVALASQGIQAPVIVIARKGMESDIIQAFRLGASDYLLWPVRDASVISAVERVLKQVRERRERENLTRQLQQTNQELQSRIRELTAIFSVGKAITSLAEPRVLYERIIEGAVRVTASDLAWFLLREGTGRPYILEAHRNLPAPLAAHVRQPWDDGLSGLVAASGEPLSIYGAPLARFKISSLGQAALVMPVKTPKQVIGLLVTMRKKLQPYSSSEQSLLEATAEYAAIALENLRAIRELEEKRQARQETASAAKAARITMVDDLHAFATQLRSPVEFVNGSLGMLLDGKKGKLTPEQQSVLRTTQDKVALIRQVISQVGELSSGAARSLVAMNMNDLSRQTLAHFHRIAQRNGLTLVSELASPPVIALGDTALMAQVLDGLLSNAVKFSRPGGQITLRTEMGPGGRAYLVVHNTGVGIDPGKLPHLFDSGMVKTEPIAILPGAPCSNLHFIKEVINAWEGKIWAESQPGQDATFHILLQCPQAHAPA